MSALEAESLNEHLEAADIHEAGSVREAAAILYLASHGGTVADSTKAAVIESMVKYADTHGLTTDEIERAIVTDEQGYEASAG